MQLGLLLAVLAVTVTTTSSTMAACPSDGWQPYQGRCYWKSDFVAPWYDLADICELALPGAQPVSVHDLLLNAFLTETVVGYAVDAWLGLSRHNDSSDWQCADGTPVNWTNWGADQPAGVGERCGFLWHDRNGDWAAESCFTYFAVVLCQVEDEPSV